MLGYYLKRGAYTSLFYVVSSGVVRIASFFCLPLFLKTLTLQEFGIWDFYQLFFSLGTLILSSCVATAITRYYLLYKDDHVKQVAVVGNALVAVVCLAIIGVVSACMVLMYYDQWPTNALYSYLTVGNIALFSLFSVLLAYLRVREFLWFYMACVITQSLVALGLTLIGVVYGYGLTAFFYANGLSYCMFVPIFLYLMSRYVSYDWKLGKEQALYTIPLVVNSIVFMGFFTIDKLFIHSTGGYEVLGLYALLWRFGSLFQFCSIALYDAWVLLIFNAHKEHNNHFIIACLTNYVYMLLATGVMVSIPVTTCAVTTFFPLGYQQIAMYAPIFFVALAFFELSRMLGAGFGLAATTTLMPLCALCGLVFQAGIISVFTGGLVGIMMGNALAFLLHGMLRHRYGTKVHPYPIVDVPCITKITVLLLGYAAFFQVLLLCASPWYGLVLVSCTWPCAVWLVLIKDEEKEWVGLYCIQGLQCIITRWTKNRGFIKRHSTHPTLLYLRTDMCGQEIKAGGSVAHTLGVINGFKERGYSVIVASSAMPSLLQEQAITYFYHLRMPPYLFFMRWKLGHLRWRLECFASNLFFALQLKSLLQKYSYSAIYQRYSLLNCVGAMVSKALKVPFILEYNGSEVWAFEHWGDKKAWGKLTWLAKAVESYNLTQADSIVVVSQVLQDELVARGIAAHKILVNPNGVDVAVYNPASLVPVRQKIRAQQHVQEKFVVGFVGTFSYWHGIEVLAQVIPAVLAQNPAVHFLLIGDGPLKVYLHKEFERHQVQQCVTLTGFVPQSQAKQYLAACDAFITPTQPNVDGTRFFGSPTKLFEYLSMGKPVIASDLEQLRDIVSPALDFYRNETITHHVGIVVPPHDVQGFVDALLYVSTLSEHERVRMGANARQRVVEKFTWNHHVQAIEQFVSQQE